VTAAILPRSYLFVPGNRPERFDKGRNSGADALIFDLEDAVPADEKDAARSSVAQSLEGGRPVYVRINAVDTPWFRSDIETLAAQAGIAGIVLPKAETPDHIKAVLESVRAGVEVLPIVETAIGFSNIRALCRSPGVGRIIFGTLDFQIDLGLEGNQEELAMYRSQIVLESRLANLPAPVDGVSTVLDDHQAVLSDARSGRRFGFGGKLCIHPKQVKSVNEAYSWSDLDRQWAQRVMAAVAESRGRAVAVDGKMVDMPVILRAKRILGRS
jgi:citrate lyase subunit beta/citryl-CoA lyase